MKKSFILYYEYFEYMDELSDVEAGKLMRAAYRYDRFGEIPEKGTLGSAAAMLFKVIKSDLDTNKAKYEKKLSTLKQNADTKDKNTDTGNKIPDTEDKASDTDKKIPDTGGVYVDVDANVDVNANANVYAAAVANAPAAEAAAPAHAAKDNSNGVKALYEDAIGKWSEHVKDRLYSYGLPPEVIRYAITEAAGHKGGLHYIESILARCKREGITSEASARARPKKTGLDSQAVEEMRRRLETKPGGGQT